MKTRGLAILFCVCLIFALAACGNAGEPAQKAEETSSTEATPTEAAQEGMPAYRYTGTEPYIGTVCDYLLKEEGQYYDEQDVMIAFPIVYLVDDTDKQNIKIWADFILDGFAVKGDQLNFECGGRTSGMIVLKEDGEDYTVTDYQIASDGAGWEGDLKKICGGDEALYEKFVPSDTDLLNQTEQRIISEYVNTNHLPITGYTVADEVIPILPQP